MDEPCCVYYELKKRVKKGPLLYLLTLIQQAMSSVHPFTGAGCVCDTETDGNKVSRAAWSCTTYIQEIHTFSFAAHSPLPSDKEEEERLEQQLTELEAGLEAAKDDLSVATMNLRAMIRAFKESRLLPQPGQFAGELTHTLSLSLIVDSIITLECDHRRITYISLNGI